MSRVPISLRLFVMGGLLGFALSRIGFTSWDEVNAMFTVSDLRLYGVFAGGVSLLALFFAIVKRTSQPSWPTRPILRGTVSGGVVFGLGWALSGACPGVTIAQLGEGRLYAVFTVGGILLGNYLYGAFLESRVERGS